MSTGVPIKWLNHTNIKCSNNPLQVIESVGIQLLKDRTLLLSTKAEQSKEAFRPARLNVHRAWVSRQHLLRRTINMQEMLMLNFKQDRNGLLGCLQPKLTMAVISP